MASQMWSTRNLVANSIVGAGLMMAGFTPFFHSVNPKANFATAASIVSGPLQQAFNLIVPDPIVTELKSLDDHSFRENMIIPNNQPVKTVIFVEKQNVTLALEELQLELNNVGSDEAKNNLMSAAKTEQEKKSAKAMIGSAAIMTTSFQSTIKNSTRPKFSKGQQNPLLVNLALGSLVIVGDEIQYLQRVQIQSGVSNSPVAVSVGPSTPQIPVGTTQAFTATITNDQNSSGVKWALSGPSCQASTCGTLTNETSTTVTYTAPGTQPSPNNTVALTATSQEGRQHKIRQRDDYRDFGYFGRNSAHTCASSYTRRRRNPVYGCCEKRFDKRGSDLGNFRDRLRGVNLRHANEYHYFRRQLHSPVSFTESEYCGTQSD